MHNIFPPLRGLYAVSNSVLNGVSRKF
jgi:hypothetical protein